MRPRQNEGASSPRTGSLDPSARCRAPRSDGPSTQKEGAVALLEKEATRFAESLDDYDHVSVTDIGGDPLVVRDHRFDLNYEIASHA